MAPNTLLLATLAISSTFKLSYGHPAPATVNITVPATRTNLHLRDGPKQDDAEIQLDFIPFDKDKNGKPLFLPLAHRPWNTSWRKPAGWGLYDDNWSWAEQGGEEDTFKQPDDWRLNMAMRGVVYEEKTLVKLDSQGMVEVLFGDGKKEWTEHKTAAELEKGLWFTWPNYPYAVVLWPGEVGNS